MSFTLRIFFMGLVAFARDDDGNVTILLKHADHAAAAAESSLLGTHSSHTPVFIYPCPADCKCPNEAEIIHEKLGLAAERLSCAGSGGACAGKLSLRLDYADTWDTFGGILLNKEEIVIEPLKEGRVACPSTRRGRLPKNSEELQDCSWIPAMGKVSSSARFINNKLIDPPDGEILAALLRLNGIAGTMKVYSVADYGSSERRIPFFKFKRPGLFTLRKSKQALADIVVIEVEVESAEAKISFNSFNGQGARSITLKPAAGKSEVEVLIGNLVRIEPGSSDSLPPTVGHYKLYYALSAGNIADFVLRFPHKGNEKKFILQEGVEPSQLANVIRVVGCNDAVAGTCRPICTCSEHEGGSGRADELRK